MKRSMIQTPSIILSLLLLTMAILVQAQTATATLKGIVSDGNNQVLAGPR